MHGSLLLMKLVNEWMVDWSVLLVVFKSAEVLGVENHHHCQCLRAAFSGGC